MLKNNLCFVFNLDWLLGGGHGRVSEVVVFHPATVKDLLGQWQVDLQDGMFLPKICYCRAMVLDFPSSLGRAKPFSCLLTDSLALLERDLLT